MISVLVMILVVGVIVGLVRIAPVIPDFFKTVVYCLACLWLLLYCLDVFGIWNGFGWHHTMYRR